MPAGGHFLVQVSARAAPPAAALPTPDVAGAALNMARSRRPGHPGNGTNGHRRRPVTPCNVANVIDFVGYGTANSFETAPTAATSTRPRSRARGGGRHRQQRADFTLGTPTPRRQPAAPLALTNPGAQTSTVGAAITPFDLAASGGTTPYTFTRPTCRTASPSAPPAPSPARPTTAGTPTVTVTVTDSAPTPATDTRFTSTSPRPSRHPIAEIQGTGATSPLAGHDVTTEGVVTAAYPTGGFNGFYIQTPARDATADASDAIFVFGRPSAAAAYPAIGDSVDVTGTVTRVHDATSTLTELTAAASPTSRRSARSTPDRGPGHRLRRWAPARPRPR